MACAYVVVFALLVSFSVNTNAHLIQGVDLDPITTKEVLIPHEDSIEPVTNVVDVALDDVKVNDVDLRDNSRIAVESLDKKCAAIGEFCMYHTDCCTNSCLGYLKKCVS